jgi:hypothetical protein
MLTRRSSESGGGIAVSFSGGGGTLPPSAPLIDGSALSQRSTSTRGT